MILLSRFAKSFLAIILALLLLSTITFLHPPSRAYLDPWSGDLFGEDGMEMELRGGKGGVPPGPHPPILGKEGGVIMSKLGNATAKAALGRATWKLLHTITLRYPEHPTQDERDALDSYFHLLSRLYPCGECAEEFQLLLKKMPPQTSSRRSASLWLCSLHNVVNERLHKEEFDCAHLDDTYDYSIKVIERFFTVPLDYADPEGEKIRIFARNLIPKSKAKTLQDEDKLPFLLFLNGGPGLEVDMDLSSTFAGELHERGYQTLWLDPRGTGLSTTLSVETLPSRLKTDQDKANYLKHFRADSIVKDCEEIRKVLIGDKPNPEDRKWTVLGASFVGKDAETVYEALIPQYRQRNEVCYRKYPRDVKRVRDIVTYLEANEVNLPNGGRLTMFYPFDGNPIYAILHESCYESNGKPRMWSAARVLSRHLEFFWTHVKGLAETEPVYFYGEMVLPDAFDDYVNLRPLKGAAEILARDSSGDALYNVDQLRKNEVKVTAATSYEDMYVEFGLAQETVSMIPNTEQYITNQLNHDGIIKDPKDLFKHLFQISKREYN
ncbi:hypothetical protein FB45DRAFT_1019984 [Roridomyces roridus]|uniref:Sulfhydryl oxidase n=1 Tax=Roridomyces roridus TaxID=1738132 RepID=A0AAD7CGJ6_9AGAR|nr:hypothetical protein FB45DRAFT_1019984 [Roridomyces roridus]